MMEYDITEMDVIRATLANAVASGLTLEDVLEMSIWAESVADFDDAVNILGLATEPLDAPHAVG